MVSTVDYIFVVKFVVSKISLYRGDLIFSPPDHNYDRSSHLNRFIKLDRSGLSEKKINCLY